MLQGREMKGTLLEMLQGREVNGTLLEMLQIIVAAMAHIKSARSKKFVRNVFFVVYIQDVSQSFKSCPIDLKF